MHALVFSHETVHTEVNKFKAIYKYLYSSPYYDDPFACEWGVQTTKYALQKEQEDNQELQAAINRSMKSHHQLSSKSISSGNHAMVPVSQSTAPGSLKPLQATSSNASLRGLSADEGEDKLANDSPSFLDTLGPKGM